MGREAGWEAERDALNTRRNRAACIHVRGIAAVRAALSTDDIRDPFPLFLTADRRTRSQGVDHGLQEADSGARAKDRCGHGER